MKKDCESEEITYAAPPPRVQSSTNIVDYQTSPVVTSTTCIDIGWQRERRETKRSEVARVVSRETHTSVLKQPIPTVLLSTTGIDVLLSQTGYNSQKSQILSGGEGESDTGSGHREAAHHSCPNIQEQCRCATFTSVSISLFRRYSTCPVSRAVVDELYLRIVSSTEYVDTEEK